jgi:hypothetical protein
MPALFVHGASMVTGRASVSNVGIPQHRFGAPRLAYHRRMTAEWLQSNPIAREYMEALSKELQERPSTITLMPEYSAEVPLWTIEGETDDLVSKALLVRLKAWQAMFDANFRPQTGWESDEVKTAWAEDAKTLETELRSEMIGIMEVEVDLWPLNPGFLHTGQPELPPHS